MRRPTSDNNSYCWCQCLNEGTHLGGACTLWVLAVAPGTVLALAQPDLSEATLAQLTFCRVEEAVVMSLMDATCMHALCLTAGLPYNAVSQVACSDTSHKPAKLLEPHTWGVHRRASDLHLQGVR